MWGNPMLVMGSGGIGERIDRTLVREDATVVVHGRDEERAGRVAAETRDATAPRPKTHYVVGSDARIGMLYWPGEEGDRRATMNFPPVDAELGYEGVDKLSEIARARGATVTQTALAWTLSRPFITSVIVGASRVSQLGDNLGAVDLELTSEELRDLDELTAPAPPYPNRMIERFPDVPVEKALWGG